MPTTAKKTAPKAAKPEDESVETPELTPAEAAAAEATGKDITVLFRKQKFVIPRSKFESLHFQIALSSGNFAKIMTESLAPGQLELLLLVVERGEDALEAASEFVVALGKAAGWGNSSASRSS